MMGSNAEIAAENGTRKFHYSTAITKYTDSTFQTNRVTPVATVDGRKV
jgi:hypothetical protein